MHGCQKEAAWLCLSVTGEYSEYPCLSLRLQNIYHVSETTVPCWPPTHTHNGQRDLLLGRLAVQFFYIWHHVHLHAWMYADVYTPAGTPYRSCFSIGGSSGLNWGLAANTSTHWTISTALLQFKSFKFKPTRPLQVYPSGASQFGLIINSASTWKSHPLYKKKKVTWSPPSEDLRLDQ